MNSEYEEAVDFAEQHLQMYIAKDWPEWFGPVAVIIAEELKISVGPYTHDIPLDKLVAGESISLPYSSVRPLINGAFLHPELFNLAKMVAGDLILLPQILPEEIRVFSRLILCGRSQTPKARRLSLSEIPSSATFRRDFAIWKTLAALETRFALSPTQNFAKKQASVETGATVVSSALGRLRTAIGVSSINNVWSKRANFENLKTHVLNELRAANPSISIND